MKMIRLAKLMGQLVMPRSHARAIAVHGTMALLRLLPAARRQFDELGIKPENAYPAGLFVPGRGHARRGAWFPQDVVRCTEGLTLSDEVLGPALALVGVGVDPTPRLSERSRRRWSCAGGNTVQLPDAAERGWCLVVRPDRTVMHDGPVEEADRLVRESLTLLGTPAA